MGSVAASGGHDLEVHRYLLLLGYPTLAALAGSRDAGWPTMVPGEPDGTASGEVASLQGVRGWYYLPPPCWGARGRLPPWPAFFREAAPVSRGSAGYVPPRLFLLERRRHTELVDLAFLKHRRRLSGNLEQEIARKREVILPG
jgi:hypothetical protein